MKPTGIICRVDDLGRIVIPKAVRLKLNIEDNEPFEIFIIDDGILLKKYALPKTKLSALI